jgi:hypothetical protein
MPGGSCRFRLAAGRSSNHWSGSDIMNREENSMVPTSGEYNTLVETPDLALVAVMDCPVSTPPVFFDDGYEDYEDDDFEEEEDYDDLDDDDLEDEDFEDEDEDFEDEDESSDDFEDEESDEEDEDFDYEDDIDYDDFDE